MDLCIDNIFFWFLDTKELLLIHKMAKMKEGNTKVQDTNEELAIKE